MFTKQSNYCEQSNKNMPKTRQFKKYSKKRQFELMLLYIKLASEDYNQRRKIGFYSLASQIGASAEIIPSDFDAIKNMTIDELAREITKDNSKITW